MTIIHKDAREASGLDFVLSDESKDRMGDIIRADGWDLRNFKKNPIALFRHDPGFPIGNWKDLRVENKRLVGTLEPAPDGTSARLDEVIRLVRHGVLKAVSVGFREIESRPLGDKFLDGTEFIRQELVETSVVSVPANPNALQIARELGVSEETRSLVFAKPSVIKERPPARTRTKIEPAKLEVSIDDIDAIITHQMRQSDLNPNQRAWRWAHDVLLRERAKLLRN